MYYTMLHLDKNASLLSILKEYNKKGLVGTA